jgi:hypothetical protein
VAPAWGIGSGGGQRGTEDVGGAENGGRPAAPRWAVAPHVWRRHGGRRSVGGAGGLRRMENDDDVEGDDGVEGGSGGVWN